MDHLFVRINGFALGAFSERDDDETLQKMGSTHYKSVTCLLPFDRFWFEFRGFKASERFL